MTATFGNYGRVIIIFFFFFGGGGACSDVRARIDFYAVHFSFLFSSFSCLFLVFFL